MKKIFFAAAMTVACFLCSCSAHKEEEHHQHDHLLITIYNDSLELFAEISPLSVGEEAHAAVHITSLSTFKPYVSSKVEMQLAVGGKTITAEPHESDTPGIYRFEFTPGKVGSGKIKFTIATPSGNVAMYADVEVFADEHDAEEAAEESMPSSGNAVAFTKEKSWKADFRTDEAANRTFGTIINTVARIEPSAGDVRNITAKAAGIVTFANPSLTDGMTVNAGQNLFTIDASATPDNNLRLRVKEAENNYNAAKRDYELKQQLRNEKLATESELREAKNRYDNAAATYNTLRGSFGSGSTASASPISGYIMRIDVSNGQYVEAGQTLATVGQNRDLYLKAELAPSYMPLLSDITDAVITFPGSNEKVTFTRLGGQVVSYGKSVDADNPLIPLVMRVNNFPGMVPGTFVNIAIEAGASTETLAVPSEAVIEEMGNHFVYRQLTPEYFEKTEVKTGKSNGIYTEILSGLTKGERIVTRGAILVKLAHGAGTLDPHAGHVH